MNANDFTYLLNNPTAVSLEQELLLDKIVAEFPYFQSARALQLKVLHNQNSFRYNQSLKVTAAHTTDRNVLFEFITSEDFAVLKSTQETQTTTETISIAEGPDKITQIFHVPVEKVSGHVSGSTFEATELSEEIVESILDAINVAESPEKIIHVSHIPVEKVSEPAAIAETAEQTIETVSEAISIADSPENIIQIIHIPVDQITEPILTSVNEETKQFEEEETETETTEEIPAEGTTNKLEQSILSSINEATQVTERIEEKTDSKLEQSILSSISEATPVEEEIPTQEIESKLEQSILLSISEATAAIEGIRSAKIDNKLEQSIISSITEATPTQKTVESEFAEEIQEAKEEKTIEEKLEIGQPLDFSKQEKHSFQEWLQLASLQPIKRAETIETPKIETEETEEIEEETIEPQIEEQIIEPEIEKKNIQEDEERKKKLALIDKFIEENPKIAPAKHAGPSTFVLEQQPPIENSYLMTETLAKVYLEQKKYQKAIQAYEILILKYPEKISFFANRIADIKALQQNNN